MGIDIGFWKSAIFSLGSILNNFIGIDTTFLKSTTFFHGISSVDIIEMDTSFSKEYNMIKHLIGSLGFKNSLAFQLE